MTNKEAVEKVRIGNYYSFQDYRYLAVNGKIETKEKRLGSGMSDRERAKIHQDKNKTLYSKPTKRR